MSVAVGTDVAARPPAQIPAMTNFIRFSRPDAHCVSAVDGAPSPGPSCKPRACLCRSHPSDAAVHAQTRVRFTDQGAIKSHAFAGVPSVTSDPAHVVNLGWHNLGDLSGRRAQLGGKPPFRNDRVGVCHVEAV